MTSSKKAPRKSAKLKALKRKSVRLSTSVMVKGGADPINSRKRPQTFSARSSLTSAWTLAGRGRRLS